MVQTESSIEQSSTSNTDRQRLLDLLDRQEVVAELEKYGISKVEATARINSLTNEEVAALNKRIGQLHAGGFVAETAAAIVTIVKVMPYVLAVVLYIPGVLVKGGICIFSDCEEKGGVDWIFTSWWSLDDEDKTKQNRKGGKLKPIDQNGCLPGCDTKYQMCANTFLSDIQVYQRPNQNFFVPRCNAMKHSCRKQCLIEMNNNYPWK
jgi:hypothetical protein